MKHLVWHQQQTI